LVDYGRLLLIMIDRGKLCMFNCGDLWSVMVVVDYGW